MKYNDKILKENFRKRGETFFCNCEYRFLRVRKCKLSSRQNSEAGQMVEWGHVIETAFFGPSFDSWKNGHPKCFHPRGFPTRSKIRSMSYSRSYLLGLTRKKDFKGQHCARKVDPYFKRMESDLYNLVPASISTLAIKKNTYFGVANPKLIKVKGCSLRILKNIFVPPDHLRGDIARIIFYLKKFYPKKLKFSKEQIRLYQSWSQIDPVSPEECKRNDQIFKIQGNKNPFVLNNCPAKRVFWYLPFRIVYKKLRLALNWGFEVRKCKPNCLESFWTPRKFNCYKPELSKMLSNRNF